MSINDINETILGLAEDETKREGFLIRLSENLSDKERRKFEAVRKTLDDAFSAVADSESEAQSIMETAKKQERARKVKMVSGLTALVALLIIWRAFKSSGEEGQRR